MAFLLFGKLILIASTLNVSIMSYIKIINYTKNKHWFGIHANR